MEVRDWPPCNLSVPSRGGGAASQAAQNGGRRSPEIACPTREPLVRPATAGGMGTRSVGQVNTLQPRVRVPLGLLALHAVTFLEFPYEFVFFTANDLKVIIGQFSILLPY